LVSQERVIWLRRKAPQIILATIAIALAVYLTLEIFEDVFIEGAPITSSPLIAAILLVTRSVTNTVQAWGYSGIFGLMLLESSSLPIPSEVILPFAGYLVSLGKLDFWIVIGLSTVAGLAGALIDYYIGMKGAESLAEHKILGKVLLNNDQLATASAWFKKHGALTVFLSRLVPGFRTTFSFPAGAARMPLRKFVAFTVAGCLLWNGLLVYFGLFLGVHWSEIAGISRYLIIATVVAVVTLIVWYLLNRRRTKKITGSNLNLSA
jgi:membrane protein DedA with SNARE-associated domain